MAAQYVADCPRCGAKRITFDLLADTRRQVEHGWRVLFETFAVCRHCGRSTVFFLCNKFEAKDFFAKAGPSDVKGSAADYLEKEGFVSMKDSAGREPPEYLEDPLKKVFMEGARCAAAGCPNAAGTMFRLCVDLATQPLLPQEEVPGLNGKTRRDLGLRLPWLFANGKLPVALQDLSTCIKEDGNDGAHKGTLTPEDAEDLQDFTFQLLDRMFTEPKRLQLAKQRRDERRKPKDAPAA